jgi:hypothetical protein
MKFRHEVPFGRQPGGRRDFRSFHRLDRCRIGRSAFIDPEEMFLYAKR